MIPTSNAVGFFKPSFDTATPVQRTLRQPVIYRGLAPHTDRMAPRLGADTLSLLWNWAMLATLCSSYARTAPSQGLTWNRRTRGNVNDFKLLRVVT